MRHAALWVVEDLMPDRDDSYQTIAGVESRHWLHIILTGPPSAGDPPATITVVAQPVDAAATAPLSASGWGSGGDRLESVVTARFARPDPDVGSIEFTMRLDGVVRGHARLDRPAPQD